MGVTGRRWCDFLVYTRYGIHLERITFDQQRWLQILCEAEYSFINHIAPVLVHSNTSGCLSKFNMKKPVTELKSDCP